jgi:hypothetical protein
MFAEMVEGAWRPGIGDPTIMGWVTVAAYCAAAWACGRAAWREGRLDGSPRSRPAPFWIALTVAMVALGINKQLDLQSLLTSVGRDVFRDWGLYKARRVYQAAFIVVIALVCAGLLGLFLWISRRNLRRRGLALLGMMFILGFVLIRASSFHHVDKMLGARLGGVKWNWILELGGIACVALGAFRIAPGGPPRRGGNHMTYRYHIEKG